MRFHHTIIDLAFLAIATNGGLTRYDGESFTTLTEYEVVVVIYGFGAQGNHRDIWDVLKDRHDNLWIAPLDGVFRHGGKTFSRFPMPVYGTRPRAPSRRS